MMALASESSMEEHRYALSVEMTGESEKNRYKKQKGKTAEIV